MDQTDSQILRMLKADSRMSFVDLGKRLDLTEGAIRARVAKLLREGVIRRFTIESKDEVKGVVMVATSRAVSTTKVSDAIRALGVYHTYEISGNFDIICFVEAESIEEVNIMVEKIRALDGVTDTSTSLVLK
jgi:DNA-binding Lrp family transcriptional regulator